MANEYLDTRLQKVADLVISKMAKMEETRWVKPWVNIENANPRNITGREYSGSNALFLTLYTEDRGYKTPNYLTFLQAKDEGVTVSKGEKSFPVFYRELFVKDQNGNKISPADYKLLSADIQAECQVKSFIKCYDVFNVDQTNMQEVQPEKYASLLQNSKLTEKGYYHSLLSDMVEKQTWQCPIQHSGNRAYYDYQKDYIRLPLKDTFTSQENYFGTMLHEMAHSTGHSSRLDRHLSTGSYAREELVAELGAALAGIKLGVQKEISEQNISYIKGWTEKAKEDNHFIYKAVVDAAKAADYTCEHLGIKNELSQKVSEAKELTNKENIKMENSTIDLSRQENPLAFLEGVLPKKVDKMNLVELDRSNAPDLFEKQGGVVNLQPVKARAVPKNPKAALFEAADETEMKPALTGIFHDAENKCDIVSNGHVLVIVRTKQSHQNSWIEAKDGSEIEGKFANYTSVLLTDTPQLTAKLSPQTINNMMDSITGAMNVKKFTYNSVLVGIDVDDTREFFDPKTLLTALRVLKANGTDWISLEHRDSKNIDGFRKPTMLVDLYHPEQKALVMPMYREPDDNSIIVVAARLKSEEKKLEEKQQADLNFNIPTKIGNAELTLEQRQALQKGQSVVLSGLKNKSGEEYKTAHIYLDKETNKVRLSKKLSEKNNIKTVLQKILPKRQPKKLSM